MVLKKVLAFYNNEEKAGIKMFEVRMFDNMNNQSDIVIPFKTHADFIDFVILFNDSNKEKICYEGLPDFTNCSFYYKGNLISKICLFNLSDECCEEKSFDVMWDVNKSQIQLIHQEEFTTKSNKRRQILYF